MKSSLHLSLIVGFVFAGLASAQDQVPWAPDFPTACKAAAEHRRLVLLHFYSDDCPPCERVEAEVFTRPDVAAAIGRNYVPLKVHVLHAPELARRYQIQRWPTDVIVTPAGLEVQRATSPQSPERYIEFVNAIAATSGTAGGQWANNMQQLGQATLGQAAGTANTVSSQAQQQWGQTVQQFAATADQARDNTLQMSQQAQDAARQYGQQAQTAVEGFQQQSQTAVQQYQQRAEGAAQFAQQQYGGTAQEWNDKLAATGQQVQQQTAAAGNQFQSAAQQFGDQSRAAAGQLYAGLSASDLRSPAPSYGAPAASPPPSAAPADTRADARSGYVPGFAAQATAAATQNPYVAAAPPQGMTPPATTVASPPTSANSQPAYPPLNREAPVSAPPSAGPQLVSASEAPPVAVDGFCPVTLLEKTAQNPKDRSAWKKGDPQFGAIHFGRTYLFVSAVEQQKFLANPDAYSPVLSGYDPVYFAAGGKLVEGKRAFGITYKNRLFLFADEASLNQFVQAPNNYAQPAYQAMQRSESDGKYR